MRFIKARFGRLDIVDNNAAATTLTGQDIDVSTMPVEVWDMMMAVNARGTMLMCKHALPILEAGGGGSIVNISSDAAFGGDIANIAYGASKAAINALTRSIATGWGGRGVRCNAIAPGLVATPALEAAMPPPFQETILASSLVPRLGQPRDIAEMVVFLASDRASWITGQVFPVDGGFTAHLPHVAGVRALLARLTAPDPL
jgi:NAD(P)-dependent dehydrogenase (short-subunit alcohol dehydrogenase family)